MTGPTTHELPPPHPTDVPACSPTDAADSERPLQNPWALLGVSVVIAGLLAAVIGFAVGALIASSSASSCSPSDGWCELGAVLVGIAAGLAAGAITYVTAGVITIRRHRAKGRRAHAVLAHLAAPFALFTALYLLGVLASLLG